ncbi:transcriptional regulator, XRE family [Rippkaea orientalis PCC 8801]|uniref:Transcriptional regulator, XRE family n=2 Tax=Rippkaea TaxID=2546365 RepID=B7K4B4_RIPO1|nr:transcriptional regulator, XRE family [Rippkaea orientalis PCC 8801]
MDARVKAFGMRVRYFRKLLGISQDDLAEKAGMHRTYIGAIERGERNVSLLNILRLADALEIKVKELFNVDID